MLVLLTVEIKVSKCGVASGKQYAHTKFRENVLIASKVILNDNTDIP
jgi:hypothetical protein